MIKEEFIIDKVIRHKAEGEVYRAVFDFMDKKSTEAREAQMQEKMQAYEEVKLLLHKRKEKAEAALNKLIKQHEYQKGRGK